MAVVEHDNLVDSSHYNQESLVYLGRYLPISDQAYQLTAKQLYQQYLPFLRQLNPQVEDSVIDYRLSKAPFAQPLIKLNHSRHLPSMRTSYPNLYWVSMQHIYPFDRGINYAIASAQQLYQVLKVDLAWLN